MKLLDLFCGAGGCAEGYRRAGFTEIVGIDIKPQPRYPFEFIQADCLRPPLDLSYFDLIHASPPCQAFSTLKIMPFAKQHPDLLTPTRELLLRSGKPFVIENVVGAPMTIAPPGLFTSLSGVELCGSMFNLRNETHELRRHRHFESNIALPQPRHDHKLPVIGFYGDHARTRQRTVAGHRDRGGDIVGKEIKLQLVRELMGIDWMEWHESNQAIPPAYTEWIGRQIIERGEQNAAQQTTVED
jgi:DNA (cytosine-5)-methyltransferase 1